MTIRSLLIILLLSLATPIFTQINVEGYIYESGNRGFIDQANVTVSSVDGEKEFARGISDESGKYSIELTSPGNYQIHIEKQPFFDLRQMINVADSERVYLEHEVTRKPGYIFEITLAEKNEIDDTPKKALKEVLVEVYNNTIKEDHLIIEELAVPNFQVNMLKGNHYTILIRKEGYLSKRMEAFVDVEGCILCFEGVGQISPGVSDNLSQENTIGTLLANVELEKYFEGKVIGLNDIYYETNKWNITQRGIEELDKVARFIKDNPGLTLELGSHTDSRGTSAYNLNLSRKRAESAAAYLKEIKGIQADRLTYKGYGETSPAIDCEEMDCSDSDHAKNRRTELRVLSIQNMGEFRTLRQMKADELLEEILEDLDNEGEIRVSADENLEEVLNQQSKIISHHEETIINEQMEATPTSILRNEETQVSEAIQAETIEFAQSDQTTKEATQGEIKENGNSGIKDGYKIVILFSRYALAGDHPLVQRFQDIEIYKTADNNLLYMIETFQSKQAAIQRLNQRYISAFPNAYIVGFENGILVD